MARPANEIEHGETAVVSDNRLSIDQERVPRQCGHCRHRQRKPMGEIMPVARDEPDTGTIPARHDAEAIAFDFVKPNSARPEAAWRARAGTVR